MAVGVATLGLAFGELVAHAAGQDGVGGGIDLVVDGKGGYWFLEINPNGEWGWLDQGAGLPIAAALADELTRR